MPHQNQSNFRNRGFLGGVIPRHQIGPGGPPRPITPVIGDIPGFNPIQFPGGGPGNPGFRLPTGGKLRPLSDLAQGLFDEEPRIPFNEAIGRQNFTPNQRQFFQTQFQPFFDRFLGQSGSALRGGTELEDIPNFTEFLGGINFQDEFRRLPPSLRPGDNTARFRPPTQFRF